MASYAKISDIKISKYMHVCLVIIFATDVGTIFQGSQCGSRESLGVN